MVHSQNIYVYIYIHTSAIRHMMLLYLWFVDGIRARGMHGHNKSVREMKRSRGYQSSVHVSVYVCVCVRVCVCVCACS